MKIVSDVDQTYNRDTSLSSTGFRVQRCNSRISLVTKKRRFRTIVDISAAMPWHGVFAFLNPILIGVLQVKYQGSNNGLASPFEAHATKMWSFLASTLVYCFASAAYMKCRGQRIRCLSAQLALISGSLSSVSIFSLFLPDSLGYWLLLSAFLLGQVVLVIIATPISRMFGNAKLWFFGNGDNCLADQRLPESFV